jgi:hypothetical protein
MKSIYQELAFALRRITGNAVDILLDPSASAVEIEPKWFRNRSRWEIRLTGLGMNAHSDKNSSGSRYITLDHLASLLKKLSDGMPARFYTARQLGNIRLFSLTLACSSAWTNLQLKDLSRLLTHQLGKFLIY